MKKVKTKGLRGITDLLAVYPYQETGLGLVYNPIIEYPEEEYIKDPESYIKVVTHMNNDYIQYLKEQNKFEEEYDLEIELTDEPFKNYINTL